MRKGFTLIELLAVIVILAIIALIATPIIINIIEDSRKNAATNSAQLYVDGLGKYIVSKNMISEFNPNSCTISNGNVSCDGTSIDYNVDGNKPTSGTVTFGNGVVSGYAICIMDYKVVKSGNNITTTKDSNCTSTSSQAPAYTLGVLAQYNPVNNEACTTGATCYKWRVIAVNNDTVTLQMDHNLVNFSAWVTQSDYNDDSNWYGGDSTKGPITALKALETATSSWDNSLKLNYTYDTSASSINYGTLSCTNGACTVAGNQITTNLKARMITGEEITAITKSAGASEGTNAYNWTLANGSYHFFSNTEYVLGTETAGTGNTDLSWLIENTTADSDSEATENTYDTANAGYWTLSPRAGSYSTAWYVHYTGDLNTMYLDYEDFCGIRPVITIPKSVLN